MMQRGTKIWGVILCLLGVWLGTAVAADKYTIDNVHSHVGFSIRHLMISNVKGNFTDFSGTISYDEKNPVNSKAKGSIKVASINTNNTDRDNHLRSADFFDATKYPEIKFETTKVTKKGEDVYVAKGWLTLHGVKKEVTIPITFLGKRKGFQGEDRIGFEGSLTLKRSEFGMMWNKMLDKGGVVVGDEVKITLDIEAAKQ